MSKYFDKLSELRASLDRAFPGACCEVRSIHSGRELSGIRTLVWVSWTDGPRRSEVAAVVEPFRAVLASLRAEPVCVREFSAEVRSTIAAGARNVSSDYWLRAVIQDFDLRPILELTAWLERSRREVRLSARARALASV